MPPIEEAVEPTIEEEPVGESPEDGTAEEAVSAPEVSRARALSEDDETEDRPSKRLRTEFFGRLFTIPGEGHGCKAQEGGPL